MAMILDAREAARRKGAAVTKSVDVAGMESSGDMVMYPPPIDDIRIINK